MKFHGWGQKIQALFPSLKLGRTSKLHMYCLFFCGSVSNWIEENILKSTAFFGRVNLTISLEPLSISESAEFLGLLAMQLSDYDMYKLLSIVGGVPWYLEQFNPNLTADDK